MRSVINLAYSHRRNFTSMLMTSHTEWKLVKQQKLVTITVFNTSKNQLNIERVVLTLHPPQDHYAFSSERGHLCSDLRTQI